MLGNDRQGMSFTMAIVVSGLVLVATAAVVISFSGSGISDFFNTVDNEQESNVEEYKVQQACSDLKEEINSNYCELYMPVRFTAQDSEDLGYDLGSQCGDGSGDGVADDDFNFCQRDHYRDEGGDSYGPSSTFWVVDESNCADASRTSRSRVLPSSVPWDYKNETTTSGLSDEVFVKTATELSCNWRQGGFDPNVEVEGQTFNCIEENYIQSDACPAE